MSTSGRRAADEDDLLVEALRRVPAFADRRFALTPLSGGITNRNLVVTVDGSRDRYVVRVPGAGTGLLGIDRQVERAATVAAAGVGVGPEVVAFIEPEGYLVTRFIEGSPIPLESLRQAATLERVAEAVRRVHDGPPVPGRFEPVRIAQTYRDLAAARGVDIPTVVDEALGIGRRIEAACQRSTVARAPCHNDLLNANLIDDGARIRIVDWEYAGMGDPFFDLGNLSVNNGLTEDEDATLLAAYDRLDPSTAIDSVRFARLTVMRVMSDLREAMWGVVQQGLSTLEVDFVTYAGEHFERLVANAHSPRFERALREIGGG